MSSLQPNHQMLSRNNGFRSRWFVSAINLFVPKDRTRCRLHASKGSGNPSFVSLVFWASKGKYIYTWSPQLPKSLVAHSKRTSSTLWRFLPRNPALVTGGRDPSFSTSVLLPMLWDPFWMMPETSSNVMSGRLTDNVEKWNH